MTQLETPWKTEVVQQVQFFDLDPMDIVWHGHYVRYLEIARCALLEKINYNYAEMKQSGYAWPIIDLHIRFVKPATFGQYIKIAAEIVEWENRLKINYLITDQQTQVRLTRASTTQVAIDIKTQKMCFASPDILLKKLRV